MSNSKRTILLMYISKVSGHRHATLAIQGALREIDPAVSVPAINGFGYAYPRLEKIVNSAYMGMIKRTPKVWDYLYDNPKIVRRSSLIQNFLHRSSHSKIKKLFDKHEPNAVVCTQAFPCGMVAHYKTTQKKNIALFAVLTDYAPHSFWINEGVDYYIVPDASVKERFLQKGVPADKIKVYGIPIKGKFARQMDKAPIAAKLGLSLNIPTLMVMGGGHGLGPIRQVVQSLLSMTMPVQLIVLSGTNKSLTQWLKSVPQAPDKKLLCFDYIGNVDELMEVSNLIITKPGGLTTSECLAKGLPMVIVDPLPGQEMRNTDFLLEKGIGIRIDKNDDVGEEVELLLRSPDKLKAMAKAAFEHARPHAAFDIANLILDNTRNV